MPSLTEILKEIEKKPYLLNINKNKKQKKSKPIKIKKKYLNLLINSKI